MRCIRDPLRTRHRLVRSIERFLSLKRVYFLYILILSYGIVIITLFIFSGGHIVGVIDIVGAQNNPTGKNGQ